MSDTPLPSKYLLTGNLLSNDALNESYHLLRFTLSSSELTFAPGQFVQIDCRAGGTMLRRPISVLDWTPDNAVLSLLVQRVGRGSTFLCSLSYGEEVSLLAPLGNSFTLAPTHVGSHPLLIGGGVGIAPLLFLSRILQSYDGVRPHIVVGARTSSLIVLKEQLTDWSASHGITTDDGSLGECGNVLSHSSLRGEYSWIYTCGPRPMMSAVRRWALSRGYSGEASLENLMGCGIGACLCCVEQTKQDGNVCACTRGPVFQFDNLLWE